MIEGRGQEIGAPISESGAFSIICFCRSRPAVGVVDARGLLHALHHFMFFQFRLWESPPDAGSRVPLGPRPYANAHHPGPLNAAMRRFAWMTSTIVLSPVFHWSSRRVYQRTAPAVSALASAMIAR